MQSGIGDLFGERYMAIPKEKIRSISDYLPLFADRPLEFEPGTRNRYSNGGYVVLGAIIVHARSGPGFPDRIPDLPRIPLHQKKTSEGFSLRFSRENPCSSERT
jgi:hypothetical protein